MARVEMPPNPEMELEATASDLPLGAHHRDEDRWSFSVWAPSCHKVELLLLGSSQAGAPYQKRTIPMAHQDGYHWSVVESVHPGMRYRFRLDEASELPDPASRFQPDGVHGPSEIVDPSFPWTDHNWRGIPWSQYVIYELHVGTATREGTFAGLIERLQELARIGITALELLPVAQFPGKRNWGYDGAFPFAAQNSYGGPAGLKKLINAAHEQGMAVILDVVYNHLGPEGNYLGSYGPYFTDRYKTPWGQALNFDGEHSDPVRRYFIENALQWQLEYHIDALRLDAVHAIRDFSAVPFLQELARATHRAAQDTGRKFYLVAETDLNDPRIIRTELAGGYGLDAQWSDDFHHVLHVLLTGEQDGYYGDFGGVDQLAKAYNCGYIFTGQHSRFRKRRHGNYPYLTDRGQMVVYAQNHDQIGNRFLGERLAALVNFEQLKLAAAAVILSPFTPMLFMGEEYGEQAPFQYFVDHEDPKLLEAVRNGRREEFAAFKWAGEMPDPCAPETFERCVLNPEVCSQSPHKDLLAWHIELLNLRRHWATDMMSLRRQVYAKPWREANALEVCYSADGEVQAVMVMNFSPANQEIHLSQRGQYAQVLDSSDARWGGMSHSPRHQSVENQVTLKPWSVQVLNKL